MIEYITLLRVKKLASIWGMRDEDFATNGVTINRRHNADIAELRFAFILRQHSLTETL